MKSQMIYLLKSAKTAVAVVTATLCLGVVHSASAITLAQSPLFLEQPVKPIVMFNMSNDHQLFFKVYDDAIDLDPDNNNGIETTYENSYDYYGYFDEKKCYIYSNSSGGVFEPAVNAGGTYGHTCSNQWSGNFLNWSTMTRMDVIRKILYGGKRSTDSSTKTVLERAYLPQDAHSYAKFYKNTDLNNYVPNSLVDSNGITMCNTTTASNVLSEVTNAPPQMLVVKGDYSLWASNEAFQCVVGVGSNGNDPAISGINASSDSPSSADSYTVRIQTCVAGKIGESENCQTYGTSNKPTGVLQKYGDGSILFGLMTGSYARNKSGGVLRKRVGDMADEVNIADGTFDITGDNSIVNTLDSFRIFGYDHGNGWYFNGGWPGPSYEFTLYDGGDRCPWGLTSFGDGQCANWGNPQSEIYLESLRYLAGLEANFSADDSTYISGLKEAAWVGADNIKPVTEQNYCAPLAVIQFNASVSSYDWDELGGAGGIGLNPSQLNAKTNFIGANEGISGNKFFVGTNGSTGVVDGIDQNDQLCTPKSVTNLSDVRGTCPEAPRLAGSYQIAGLAYYANTTGIMDIAGKPRPKVRTFGVALAPAIPQITVPGTNVKILPACHNIGNGSGLSDGKNGNCAIVDFKFLETTASSGKVFISWEDSEQGGDYDMDMWGTLEYQVAGGEIKITTDVIHESNAYQLGFGYVISGTNDDGFHVHSGVDGFDEDGCAGGCNEWDGPSESDAYTIGGSAVGTLQQPLYYAAKWGGFDVETDGVYTHPVDGDVPVVASGQTPPTYFLATNPRKLQEDIETIFKDIAGGKGAAASVATNSTRLGTDTFVYQALFNSTVNAETSWYGNVRAISLAGNVLATTSTWEATAAGTWKAPGARQIFTYNKSTKTGVVFKPNQWAQLTTAQKQALKGAGNNAAGKNTIRWLRGTNVTGLRQRDGDKKLGDIVNSDPVFFGKKNFGFARLNATLGGGTPYLTHFNNKAENKGVIYVGANDGMLHAFDARNGKELFAYIPTEVFGSAASSKLRNTTLPNYGANANKHKYLVDGQTFVGDVYVPALGGWRTLLVGTLGAGGKGLFVLDVTDPHNFSAANVLYEITGNNVGFILGKPTIAPMPDGTWKIIFGNGYNSTNGFTGLILADPKDGSITDFIQTATGEGGLSEPSISIFANGTVKAAYAGDLAGNLWKFDLKTKAVAVSGDPLFVAEDGGNRQPITAPPVLGLNEQRLDTDGRASTMVYFGTGQYLNKNATLATATATLQSFYGIADRGDGTTIKKSDLSVKSITSEAGGIRTITGANENLLVMDWAVNDPGWVLDFNTKEGERVKSKSLLVFDRLIFPTIVPTTAPCDFGGQSWIMELVGVGGLYDNYTVLDNEQGVENSTLVSLSDLIIGEDGAGVIIKQNSNGTLETEDAEQPDGLIGRQSWRQIQ